MTTTKELEKLFRAIRQRNWSSVDEAAQVICEMEDSKGHHGVSRVLRGALNPNGKSSLPEIRGHEKSTSCILPPILALTEICDKNPIDAVRMPKRTRGDLDQFLEEWRHSDVLTKGGLRCRSKLLLHGPPGCGKSMTAGAIGYELNLPVFVVRFDAIIGSLLGQTAIHLRQLFQFAESTACVLLIDEIDAIGKRRGNVTDIGELDRIVVSLLQELEHSHPLGIVVATSNLASQLDGAIWRRFDLVVSLPRPSRRELQSFGAELASVWDIPFSSIVKKKVSEADGFATVRQIIEDNARRALLNKARD